MFCVHSGGSLFDIAPVESVARLPRILLQSLYIPTFYKHPLFTEEHLCPPKHQLGCNSSGSAGKLALTLAEVGGQVMGSLWQPPRI